VSVNRPSVCHGCIVAKRCEIGPELLLITNRKSHIGFQMTRKSLTLGDLEDQYCNSNCRGSSAFSLATAKLLVAIKISYCTELNLFEVALVSSM